MQARARLALLDIEGTLSPLAFVRDVMFPFAVARYEGFFERRFHDPDLAAAVSSLRAEAAREPGPVRLEQWCDAADYCARLTREDRKATGLKAVQGLIWDEGFASGELKPPLFADARPALERWRTAGMRLAIYSSGSEHAQRQFFAHTNEGDLGALFEAFFDTAVGMKKDPASYTTIALRLGLPSLEICFFSDVVAELEAAAEAGMRAVLVHRPGNAPQPPWGGLAVDSFEGVELTGV